MIYETVAAVDLGSNSFRLQVGRVVDEQIYPLDSLKEPVRLASGLGPDKLLDVPSQARALDALRRFGERLRVNWELDAAASRAVVPPLLLQPLVENAVKHGVEPSDRGGVIRVRTRVERGEVVVVVTNTVSGGPGKPGHGIALRNLRERLRLLHDVETRFDAGLVEPGVYRVRIVLPLGE